MTIVFFSRLFFPHGGGVEKHVGEISKHMIADGHKIIVVTENHGWKSEETIDGIHIYRIPVEKKEKRKKIIIWSWLLKHKKFFEQADIVHCHDVFFWYLPFKFLYPSKPVFTTFHGYETVFPPTIKAKFVRKISEKLSLGNICVGKYIEKWYGTKADYITYGGATQNSSADWRIKTQNYSSIVKIIFVGRLDQDNGINIYLQVLDLLKKKNIVFTFEAYGNGSLRKIVEQYGKVHGFVENISDVLEQTDLVFASSYLSIFEAFAHKKAVFSVFDNALKKDYLTMTPFSQWIYPTDSPEKLAGHIFALLKNQKEYHNGIENAFAWVENQSWKNVVKDYYTLWKVKV